MKFPITFGLVLAILASLHGCNKRTSETGYSTESQRAAWKNKLEAESVIPAKTVFHPFGHLAATSGKFLIPEASPEHVRAWLNSHGEMLGIPSQAEVISRDADISPDVSTDVPTRTVTYEVTVNGFPFMGLPIRVCYRSEREGDYGGH